MFFVIQQKLGNGYIIFIAIGMALLLGCDQSSHSTLPQPTQLEVWVHAGQAQERAVIDDQVKRFNAQHKDIQVKLTSIPERSYNAQVQAAAVAGELPDILEFDGPFLYSYIWQQQLRPLDDLLPATIKQDLIPSIIEQGTYQGKLYAVGTFDSGLGLYARRSALKAINATLPQHPNQAWTADEFQKILNQLARNDPDKAVLDLKLNYGGEWLTYAFSPMLQSAGGDLIDRTNYQRADKQLNSDASIQALTFWQTLIQANLIDPNVDDGAFVSGRVALSWAGHWEYARYRQALGEDLLVLPLPNFGKGSKTGQGSWAWSITQSSQHPQPAAKFLSFLLRSEEVLAMANANGAVPATHRAIKQSSLYQVNGPLQLFATQLINGFAIPRPKTPAYPVITQTFQRALLAIRDGRDVKQALNTAVKVIEQDIQDNKGYRL